MDVTIEISDGELTSSKIFSINVESVNDIPVLTKIKDINEFKFYRYVLFLTCLSITNYYSVN